VTVLVTPLEMSDERMIVGEVQRLRPASEWDVRGGPTKGGESLISSDITDPDQWATELFRVPLHRGVSGPSDYNIPIHCVSGRARNLVFRVLSSGAVQ
jgi:hypothetical protein